ncbi:hypothetical protein MMC22_011468 [Lobaria immixta]|nr:hypothetical protein [Lobaria immixta]
MPQAMQLFWMRILEVLIALVYLALMVYSGTHPGWWMYLQSPLVTAAMITTLLTIPNSLKIRTLLVNSASAFAINVVRSTIELLLVVLWTVAFICMVLPKGGDMKHGSNRPPYEPWILAIVLSAVESVCFTYSAVLVKRENNPPVNLGLVVLRLGALWGSGWARKTASYWKKATIAQGRLRRQRVLSERSLTPRKEGSVTLDFAHLRLE